MKKSKYYYDYTRNMSEEQEKEFYKKNHCGRPSCDLSECLCEKKLNELIKDSEESFDKWTQELEDGEQPTCNLDNPEECENCGS